MKSFGSIFIYSNLIWFSSFYWTGTELRVGWECGNSFVDRKERERGERKENREKAKLQKLEFRENIRENKKCERKFETWEYFKGNFVVGELRENRILNENFERHLIEGELSDFSKSL